MGYLTISTNVRRYQTCRRWRFFLSGRQHIGAHALCVQRGPTAAALSTSFLLNHAPNSPSWMHWLQDLGSHTATWVWVKKMEEIKQRLVEFWQCTDTAFEWKMRFSCFHILPGSAEAQVTWGGTVKRLLIAYFIGNISAKTYQCIHVCQSYSKPKVGRFLRHSVDCWIWHILRIWGNATYLH